MFRSIGFGFTPLSRMTSGQKKNFYFEAILDWIPRGNKPMEAYHFKGRKKQLYYFICDLAFGRFAVYLGGKVYIAQGREPDGALKLEPGVVFDPKVGGMLNGNTCSVREGDFAQSVQYFVQRFYPNA